MEYEKVGRRACILYTIDGEKEATAIGPYDDWAGRVVYDIVADDGTYTVPIHDTLVESKFRNDPKPTFYAC